LVEAKSAAAPESGSGAPFPPKIQDSDQSLN
jgi:hypothetical protein